jgi:SAM-dependent methyltransferase
MSSLGWLDISNIDFNALLLLEPLHARYIAQRKPDQLTGTALNAHPAVQWYLKRIYPPISGYIDQCLMLANSHPSDDEIRGTELAVLEGMHDWLIYVLGPAKYDQLAFLDWDDSSLLEIADFKDKIVLDIGAGTARLAFVVTHFSRVVYAVEPVANLRRYLYEKYQRLSVDKIYPMDGSITQIPLEDNFADILMAGHVFSDDFDVEYAEMQRVVRDGGMILLHPGSSTVGEYPAHDFLIERGFDFDTF